MRARISPTSEQRTSHAMSRSSTLLLALLLPSDVSSLRTPTAAVPRRMRPALAQQANVGRHSCVAMLLDPATAWDAYNVELVTNPLVTKAITAGVIIGAGDAAAQLVENSKSGGSFDPIRYLRWAFFGLVLQGPWNHFFYLQLDAALPPTPDPFTLTTLEKVGIDQFVQAPIFTIIILVFFAIVEGKGLAFAKNQVQTELGGILIKNWSIFIPATAINIAFCPPELRVRLQVESTARHGRPA